MLRSGHLITGIIKRRIIRPGFVAKKLREHAIFQCRESCFYKLLDLDHFCGVRGATLIIGTLVVTITLMLTLSTLRAPMTHVCLVAVAQVTTSTPPLAWRASCLGPRQVDCSPFLPCEATQLATLGTLLFGVVVS